jgi:hypothetical protein
VEVSEADLTFLRLVLIIATRYPSVKICFYRFDCVEFPLGA